MMFPFRISEQEYCQRYGKCRPNFGFYFWVVPVVFHSKLNGNADHIKDLEEKQSQCLRNISVKGSWQWDFSLTSHFKEKCKKSTKGQEAWHLYIILVYYLKYNCCVIELTNLPYLVNEVYHTYIWNILIWTLSIQKATMLCQYTQNHVGLPNVSWVL